ncbi:MAG: hypothetical protein GWO00_21485, partial [Gemmatimonadetes bacterium]|nr:hypothetical protein [Gemmatimonadota bacterium]NIT89650.1 hypothetical protein [Gemmatimonadota bacterium]NIV63765.1 hypothetical protein [Gemmatimonadota bacterium]NIW66501.1 hypothetical protein [Gemmatimonadota bacterium]NIX41783.1 hypothetical protein [Gemmatimonadota bacterium]
GVLCPNSALEAIAWCNPTHAKELEEATDLKRWFIREFGSEVTEALAEPPPKDD